VTDAPLDDEVAIRRASAGDAGAIADVYLASFHATYDFPLAHTDDEVRDWLTGVVASGGPPGADQTWVAEASGRVVGLMVLDEAGIDQLYVDPAMLGRGIGSRLVAIAKTERPSGLGLYTFQVNDRARRFYERHGFVATWFGDGSANEEGQPDVRYEWRP
jgi:ribosomal protein S18 acetylase RimI-like enzyme